MYLTQEGERIAEINWLRNPFGLINWVQDNLKPEKTKYTLYEVCNNWAYENGKNIEKEEFLKTVLSYREKIQSMTEGYFFFDLVGYRTFVEPNIGKMKMAKDIFGQNCIAGEKYADDMRLMVPMEQFKDIPTYGMGLDDYKKWYEKLVTFARLLQIPDVEFYCSK